MLLYKNLRTFLGRFRPKKRIEREEGERDFIKPYKNLQHLNKDLGYFLGF
jgi:hypothetical protein